MNDIGAIYERSSGTCRFRVWAPLRKSVTVKIVAPTELAIPMERTDNGYWTATVGDLQPGTRYFYRIDGDRDRPDPASRFQPEGVHGPSQVVDLSAFAWEDHGWQGIALRDFVIYELHVGAFTPVGTFDAIIPRLDYLKELGITVVEFMPIAQFPGTRNWGYDGVYPYSVQNSYGGPEGLMRLVNACHRKGLSVALDVVYNHLGPEGNYLWDFGPYFTGNYRTPWGDAINFDGPYSDDVRSYFIENALHWIRNFHVDALRIDAIHGIFDFSAKHFLQELGEAVHQESEKEGRNVYVIPESDLNDVRVIDTAKCGGYDLDAQWNDDFHHTVHTLLTGEHWGYYEDFGKIGHLEKAVVEGFVYSGQYSRFRRRRHGSSSKNMPAHQFVVFSQNHDQVGNRPKGERLSSLVSFEQLKLAGGVVLLSPFIPLLFMGEEYGETAPFQYFVSHSAEALANAVRVGRSTEFAHLGLEGSPPDPLAETTFLNSKINTDLQSRHEHRTLLALYRELIRLRKDMPALRMLSKESLEVSHFDSDMTLFMRRWAVRNEVICLFNFSGQKKMICFPSGKWNKVLDSSDKTWGGPGAVAGHLMDSIASKRTIPVHAHSFVLYQKAGG